eukprot:3812812-Amphidinium_carterae.1
MVCLGAGHKVSTRLPTFACELALVTGYTSKLSQDIVRCDQPGVQAFPHSFGWAVWFRIYMTLISDQACTSHMLHARPLGETNMYMKSCAT